MKRIDIERVDIDHGIVWWWEGGYRIFKDVYHRRLNKGFPDNEFQWWDVAYDDCYWMVLK